VTPLETSLKQYLDQGSFPEHWYDEPAAPHSNPAPYQHWQSAQQALQEQRMKPHSPRHAHTEQSQGEPDMSHTDSTMPTAQSREADVELPVAEPAEAFPAPPARQRTPRVEAPQRISSLRRIGRAIGGFLLLVLGIAIGTLSVAVLPIAVRYNHGFGTGIGHALPLAVQLGILGGCVLLMLLCIGFCGSAISVWRGKL
jgi:hypothetical protein